MTIVILAYVSTILYIVLLGLELNNIYRYIYVKKKYELVPLLHFYTLSVPVTMIRIYMNIWIVEAE